MAVGNHGLANHKGDISGASGSGPKRESAIGREETWRRQLISALQQSGGNRTEAGPDPGGSNV
ncbi:hypothetical protein DSCA_58640 [Desulfosarcina alkanivorans]|uniref:Uncharacterized protein n=1 Tax=Desulfosarcina alkanivorans TaxID=571177 RepID=A0A5K7Z0B5_9BACT|nr:hypothetical protein DSCA_58640 [Desulfosarcina alkanivorans]